MTRYWSFWVFELLVTWKSADLGTGINFAVGKFAIDVGNTPDNGFGVTLVWGNPELGPGAVWKLPKMWRII
jgi:hypothetical protein